MIKIGVISLGCEKNRVDTEQMLGYLRSAGHVFTNDPAEAEVLIVNTCGFIEPAKQESINTILEMAAYKNEGRCRLLAVTGCLSQRYGKELREALPEIDVMTGVRDYDRLPGLIEEALQLPRSSCAYEGRVLTTPSYRAYLRISDGCNNRCTYCAIPLIRGNMHSVPMEQLLEEAANLADGGVTELTVIAQDTSCYGTDLYGKPMLTELLRRLSEIEKLHWIRVLYTYPDTVTPELIETLRSDPKLISYLDMPLQHINDDMLKAMNRRGDQAHVRRVLEYVEQHAPEFMLRTTMMVGFPGETEEQFSEMVSFLTEHPFDRVGAFAYSPEDGTRGAELPDQIPEEIKQERLDLLMRSQKKISAKRNQKRIGTVTEVLIEGSDNSGSFGRSYAEAPDGIDGSILLPGVRLAAGTYHMVEITDSRAYDLIGRLV